MQRTAYEARISAWSSDACPSDLVRRLPPRVQPPTRPLRRHRPSCIHSRQMATSKAIRTGPIKRPTMPMVLTPPTRPKKVGRKGSLTRSEEHTSELQSLMRISYAVFCLKKKKQKHHP